MFRCALVAFGLFFGVPSYAQTYDGPYFGTVTRIIDGDTFEATIGIWPSIDATVSVRLRGYDAPELRRSGCIWERSKAELALSRMVEVLPEGATVILTNVSDGSFAGRVIADVDRFANVQGRALVSLLGDHLLQLEPGQTSIDWCQLRLHPTER